MTSFSATDSNTVSRSMHIKSLQYAKVNKARKTRWDVQTDGDLENKIESLQPPSKIDDFDMDRLDGKDLTLEEILSLETDQDFWRIFQKPGGEERKPVPIYNVNRCALD